MKESGIASGSATPYVIYSQTTTANASRSSLPKKNSEDTFDEKVLPIEPLEACISKLKSIEDGRGDDDEKIEAALGNTESQDDYPDGGWQAWGVLFGTWWMNFFTFGNLNSFGAFQQYYVTHLLDDASYGQVAWIGAFQIFAVFGLGIFAGRLFDLGFMRPILAVSSISLVLCLVATSFCTQYWQIFLAQGVGLGVSMGFVCQICIGVPSHWFYKKRATAMGVLASGGGAGGTILPIFVRQMIPRLGFDWTIRIIALGAAVIFFGCFFLIKTRLPPKAKVSSKWLDLDAFKLKSFSFFALGAAFIMLGMYLPIFTINTFTSVHKIQGDGYWLSCLNASSILGRLIPSFMADRFGKMNVLLPHAAVAALLIFVYPLFDNLSIAAFAIIYGYCTGAYISLAPVCVNQLGPTSTVGARVGALFSCLSIAGLLGSPITGYVMGNQPYRWWASACYGGSCLIIGVSLLLVSRHYAARQLGRRP